MADKSRRGGPRPGSGRPKPPEPKTERLWLTVTPTEKAAVLAYLEELRKPK